jgi:hypothetical protein
MHRLVNSISLLTLLVVWWQAATSYRILPARIPIHFNILGRPDGWGARWMIYFLPLLATIMALLWLLGLTGFGKAQHLSEPMLLPFALLLLTIVGGFAFINRRIVTCALGEATGIGIAFLPIFLTIIFGLSTWLSSLGYRR